MLLFLPKEQINFLHTGHETHQNFEALTNSKYSLFTHWSSLVVFIFPFSVASLSRKIMRGIALAMGGAIHAFEWVTTGEILSGC